MCSWCLLCSCLLLGGRRLLPSCSVLCGGWKLCSSWLLCGWYHRIIGWQRWMLVLPYREARLRGLCVRVCCTRLSLCLHRGRHLVLRRWQRRG